MINRVEFRGLASMAYNLRQVPRFMAGAVSRLYTRRLMDQVFGAYVANLTGPRRPAGLLPDGRAPVTLPVGIRSGALVRGARKRQINQWAFEVYNDEPHAGSIEDGTRYMAPRRPLGDAVDQAGVTVPGAMGDVMVEVTGQCGN